MLTTEPIEPIVHPWRLVDAAVIADLLNCTRWAVYDRAKRGDLPFIKIGHRYRFDYDLVVEWVRKGGTPERKGPVKLSK